MSRFRGRLYLALLVLLFVIGASVNAFTSSPSARVSFSAHTFSVVHVTVIPLSSTSVIGPPSLSAAFMNRVLAAYHSPAVGLGSALHVDSLRFHIDAAYALGFFLEESTFGTTGVARVTRSLGNIICSGYATCFQGFRLYPSWQVGAWDWFRLLSSEYLPRGFRTVEAIVPVYAPASDGNHPPAYIATVLHAVATWRAGRVWVG